ncbi:hypothetical protein ElyMa_002926200 [Elysia marginata]|uniref:Uncharacterized protein n=1 Tax=Elysia marginata TaxID=1093978 RepID=A0AAV4I640_9GAST|nr:hypothetical protein ElyMa_002926200 [Elysia marginata]
MVKNVSEESKSENKTFDFLIKMVIKGIDQVCEWSQDNYVATIGVEFLMKDLKTKSGDTVKLQFHFIGQLYCSVSYLHCWYLLLVVTVVVLVVKVVVVILIVVVVVVL